MRQMRRPEASDPFAELLRNLNEQMGQEVQEEHRKLSAEYRAALEQKDHIWISQVMQEWWRSYTEARRIRFEVPPPNITTQDLEIITGRDMLLFYAPGMYMGAEQSGELSALFGTGLITEPEDVSLHNVHRQEGWYLLELHPEKPENRPVVKNSMPFPLTYNLWFAANHFHRDIHSGDNKSFFDQEGSTQVTGTLLLKSLPATHEGAVLNTIFARMETKDSVNAALSPVSRHPTYIRSVIFIPNANHSSDGFRLNGDGNGPGGGKPRPVNPRPGGPGIGINLRELVRV